MASLLNDNSIDSINFEKELKISELEFKDKGLKRLSDKVKKQKASLYWHLNKHFFSILPFNTSALKNIPEAVNYYVASNRASLLSSLKSKFVDQEV
mmetsp:Transcript_41597/g.63476  ORF Transcript_41597/g.63476 Transcript_41597/m.63476 type:complete len:96 (+) Transcript_41597:1293-1580(+)